MDGITAEDIGNLEDYNPKMFRAREIQMSAILLLTAGHSPHFIYRILRIDRDKLRPGIQSLFHGPVWPSHLLALFIMSLSCRVDLSLNLIKQSLIRQHRKPGRSQSWHQWKVSNKTETTVETHWVNQKSAPEPQLRSHTDILLSNAVGSQIQ